MKIFFKRFSDFLEYRGWEHWNKEPGPETAHIYRNRRERFTEENDKAEQIKDNFKDTKHINFMHDVWRNHKIPKVFVNMKKEVEDLKALNKLIELFERRKLEISYDIFIDYFKNDEIRDKFFDREDYEIDYEKESIAIKNWLIIPILGILRMIDDYKNDSLKEGFELCPYATLTNPGNEKAYSQIRIGQIREGECQKLFSRHLSTFSCYDRIYELKNWNAYLTYNGVRYFYWIQDKQHLIVEDNRHAFVHIFTHQIYKFLYSSNPIDLISVVLKIEEFNWNPNFEISDYEILNKTHRVSIFKMAYKQILIKEDLNFMKNSDKFDVSKFMNEDHSPILHFPVVLPTYVLSNHCYMDHLEKDYENIVNFFTSESFKSIFVPAGNSVAPSDDISFTSSQSQINIDFKGIEEHSKFLLDMLSAQVKSEREQQKYMNEVFDFVGNIFK
jgi:hypothetical protein